MVKCPRATRENERVGHPRARRHPRRHPHPRPAPPDPPRRRRRSRSPRRRQDSQGNHRAPQCRAAAERLRPEALIRQRQRPPRNPRALPPAPRVGQQGPRLRPPGRPQRPGRPARFRQGRRPGSHRQPRPAPPTPPRPPRTTSPPPQDGEGKINSDLGRSDSGLPSGVPGRHDWRWRWDLNPRRSCLLTRFRGVLLRPLGHATAVDSSGARAAARRSPGAGPRTPRPGRPRPPRAGG